MTNYEPYVRPFVAEDAKAESRERALDQILRLIRHPGVDVAESESLLWQFIRQCCFDAWEEGYVAGNSFGWEYAQDTYDGPSEDPTVNPYAERD